MKIILALTVLLISSSIIGQIIPSEIWWDDGYIIKSNNIKEVGLIQIANSNKIRFKAHKKDPVENYSLDQIQEFMKGNKLFEIIKYQSNYYIMEKLIDGTVSLYKYHVIKMQPFSSVSGPAAIPVSENGLFVKTPDNEIIYFPEKQSFIKKRPIYIKLFIDCPDVLKKIREVKNSLKLDFYELLEEYNNCTKNVENSKYKRELILQKSREYLSDINYIYNNFNQYDGANYYTELLNYLKSNIYIVEIKEFFSFYLNKKPKIEGIRVVYAVKGYSETYSYQIGRWNYFYSNGQQKKIVNYNIKGEKHGDSIYYDKEGKIIKTEKYMNGEKLR